MNQCQLFRESLKHNYAISVLSHAIALPPLLPRWGLPFVPHFEYFTEYLTPVNPPIFFSHVLADRSVGIISGGAPVITNTYPEDGQTGRLGTLP